MKVGEGQQRTSRIDVPLDQVPAPARTQGCAILAAMSGILLSNLIRNYTRLTRGFD